MGVWIEIIDRIHKVTQVYVTPCVGVWIEIKCAGSGWVTIFVTPCVGVWIEIAEFNEMKSQTAMSLPAWECGLKC